MTIKNTPLTSSIVKNSSVIIMDGKHISQGSSVFSIVSDALLLGNATNWYTSHIVGDNTFDVLDAYIRDFAIHEKYPYQLIVSGKSTEEQIKQSENLLFTKIRVKL